MKGIGGSSRAQFLKVWPLDLVHQNQGVEARECVFKSWIPKLHPRHIESAFLTLRHKNPHFFNQSICSVVL